MFDLDELVNDCKDAITETQPRLAIKEVLERAMHQPGQIADVLPATRAEIAPVYMSDGLTIIKAVWAPHMSFRPHNHLMWAAIGLYCGQEDNTLYRRDHATIVESGGRQLRTSDVILLGDDTIHAVANPLRTFTGAIHIYGGNLSQQPGRSEWDQTTFDEVDYDFDRVKQYFEDANADLVTEAD
jgi:predicted metal-dependent enzyme (double-stranded beta helix superfamily)